MSEPVPMTRYYLPYMMTQEFILYQHHQQQFNWATVYSLLLLHVNPKTVNEIFILCKSML